MMIYLICEVVDLGYHVVSGYTSKERAEVELQKAINQARTQRIEDLKKINYTQEAAATLSGIRTAASISRFICW